MTLKCTHSLRSGLAGQSDRGKNGLFTRTHTPVVSFFSVRVSDEMQEAVHKEVGEFTLFAVAVILLAWVLHSRQ